MSWWSLKVVLLSLCSVFSQSYGHGQAGTGLMKVGGVFLNWFLNTSLTAALGIHSREIGELSEWHSYFWEASSHPEQSGVQSGVQLFASSPSKKALPTWNFGC